MFFTVLRYLRSFLKVVNTFHFCLFGGPRPRMMTIHSYSFRKSALLSVSEILVILSYYHVVSVTATIDLA